MEGRKVGHLIANTKLPPKMDSETTPTNNFVHNADTCWIQRLGIILVLLFIIQLTKLKRLTTLSYVKTSEKDDNPSTRDKRSIPNVYVLV